MQSSVPQLRVSEMREEAFVYARENGGSPRIYAGVGALERAGSVPSSSRFAPYKQRKTQDGL
jgi:hypothetical protein